MEEQDLKAFLSDNQWCQDDGERWCQIFLSCQEAVTSNEGIHPNKQAMYIIILSDIYHSAKFPKILS